MLRNFARFAVACVLAVPAVMFAVMPAQADKSSHCGQGYYCTFTDARYNTGICIWEYSDNNYEGDICWNGPIGYHPNDTASSYINNGMIAARDDVISYRHANNTNDRLWYVRRGEWRAEVSPCVAEPCNDQASAHQWV